MSNEAPTTTTAETKEQSSSPSVISSAETPPAVIVEEQKTEAVQPSAPLVDHISQCNKRYSVSSYYSESDTKRPFNNFLKSVRWSPDGLCLLASSEDNVLRLFEVPVTPSANAALPSSPVPSSSVPSFPSLNAVLQAVEAETVYDFSWNPSMHSSRPPSCYFATTSRQSPAHIWDAFTGKMKASYVAYDRADEVTSAISLAFNPAGDKLYCGYHEVIRIFDVDRPARKEYEERELVQLSGKAKKRKRRDGQRGLISAICVAPENDTYAAGSYTGQTCVYACDNGEMVCSLQSKGGITHLRFSPDGRYLFTGSRKDDEILCWDVRNTYQVLGRFYRKCDTNQHISFDVDNLGGRFLATGSQDGQVYVYDLLSTPNAETAHLPVAFSFQAHKDSANSVAFHPYFSQHMPLLATSSGQRKFNVDLTDDDAEDLANAEDSFVPSENSVCVWDVT